MNLHPSHEFQGGTFRCSVCGATVGSIAAGLRCFSPGAERPCDTESREIDWLAINAAASAT